MILILEIIRALVLGILFFYLLFSTRNAAFFTHKGWRFILAGFFLLFIGGAIDITDEFPQLSFLIVVGPTPVQAILEKIVGYAAGSFFIFVGFIQFIPLIKNVFQIQKELKDVNENLEKRIYERTEELQTASKIKSDFISIMSHEIRTPLNVILGSVFSLEKGNLDDNQRSSLQKLNKSANNLLSIFNDILEYSDLDSGSAEIEKSKFSLHEFFQKLFNEVNPKAEKKELLFVIKSGSKVSMDVEGYQKVLKRTLLILIDNAIKFTHKGQIRILLEELKENETVSRIKFTVEDTGIGISKEDLNRIANFFTQIEPINTRKYGGIGLGLAICKKLLELADGKFEVESDLNSGSKFIITLPFVILSGDKNDILFENKSSAKIENSDSKKNVNVLSSKQEEELLLSLKNLRLYLEDFDAEAQNYVQSIKNAADYDSELSKIKNLVSKYEFEPALAELNELISSIEQ